jgi:hypothetical protein
MLSVIALQAADNNRKPIDIVFSLPDASSKQTQLAKAALEELKMSRQTLENTHWSWSYRQYSFRTRRNLRPTGILNYVCY